MKRWHLGYYAISGCVSAALLAGCGALRQAQGDTPPVAAPATMPQARALAARGDTSNYKVLYSFRGRPNGADSHSSLVDVHGTLYGTTAGGGGGRAADFTSRPAAGGIGRGTAFTITTSGTEKVLYVFNGFEGGADRTMA